MREARGKTKEASRMYNVPSTTNKVLNTKYQESRVAVGSKSSSQRKILSQFQQDNKQQVTMRI
jgi:hypothetical protein